MVWQFVVEPGAQSVTLTVGILMTPLTPRPTVIGTVFAAVAAIGCWVGLAGSEPPFSEVDVLLPEPLLEFELELSPPPPQAATADTNATAMTACIHPLSFSAIRMVRIVRPRIT